MVGNASIESAKANGNIINVSTINYKVKDKGVFGGTYCIVITGN